MEKLSMKKIFLILLIMIAIVVAGNYYYQKQRNKSQENSTQNAQSQTQPEQKKEPEPTSNLKTYTLEEVAQHGPQNPNYENLDPKQSCWMVIHDKVYAIPDSFTETHPGGHAIYEGCGTDATILFETRPSGTGTPHSANARSILEKYYIGELKK